LAKFDKTSAENLKDDIPSLSQESNQLEEDGRSVTITESEKMEFKLSNRLMEISQSARSSKSKVHKKQTPKKSYELESENPYTHKPAQTRLLTNNDELKEKITRIENEIKRKRRTEDMEEFFDLEEEFFDPQNPSIVKSDEDSSSRVNTKSKNQDNVPYFHSAKRMKKQEVTEEPISLKKRKKIDVSRATGWIVKENKPKKSTKNFDAFQCFDSSKDNVSDNERDVQETKEKEETKEKRKKKQKKKSVNI
jgi:hypothetical protein